MAGRQASLFHILSNSHSLQFGTKEHLLEGPGETNVRATQTGDERDAVPKRCSPDKHPRTRHRSFKKQPVEGGGTPSVRKYRRMETEDEQPDGNNEIIRPSGEPPCHLSTNPVPLLVPNSALAINTEVSRDFFGPTYTGVR